MYILVINEMTAFLQLVSYDEILENFDLFYEEKRKTELRGSHLLVLYLSISAYG